MISGREDAIRKDEARRAAAARIRKEDAQGKADAKRLEEDVNRRVSKFSWKK